MPSRVEHGPKAESDDGVSHPGKSFTAKQGQYLAYIDAYTRVHRRPPAEWEMQRHFGVTPPSVHQMVINLERAGLIRANPACRAASRFSFLPRTCLSCKLTSDVHDQIVAGGCAHIL